MGQRALICLFIASSLSAGNLPARGDGDVVYQYNEVFRHMPEVSGPAWSTGAEWVYWKVRGGDLHFAVPHDGTTSIGRVATLGPEFDHGVRLGLGRQDGCFGCEIQYTYFSAEDLRSVSDPIDANLAGTLIIDDFTGLTQGDIELARSRWSLDYHVVDLNAGYDIVIGNRFHGRLLGGVKFAYIDQEMRTLYSDSVLVNDPGSVADVVRQSTRLDGYGLNLGLSGGAAVTERVQFFGRLTYSPLISSVDRSFVYLVSDDGLATTATAADLGDDRSRLLGVVDMAVGLNMLVWGTSVVDTTLSFGYEFQHWMNYPGLMVYTNESGEITFDRNVSNLTLDGPFAALILSF